MAHDMQPVDIMELVDRLEAHVTGASRFFRSNRVLVEEVEFLALLDQLRQAVPVEMQQARRIIQERQKIILDAQTEAEKIVTTARDRAEYLLSDKGLTAEAKYRSEDYLRQAR